MIGDRLTWISASGRLAAWSLVDLQPDPALSEQLSFGAGQVRFIAGDGEKLWGYSQDGVLQWTPGPWGWRLVVQLEAEQELLWFLANRDGPVLLFPDHVHDLSTGRVYRYPELQGQVRGTAIAKVLDAKVLDGRLWVGAGFGEWGGYLLALDLRTGTWSQHVDSYAYPTGIERSRNGGVLVSWSMSHISTARALLRIHRPDGSVQDEGDLGEPAYLQKVARVPSDGSTYVVNEQTLVRVDGVNLKETVADLGSLPYGLERNAVGVAPGIVQMFGAVPDSLVIIPATVPPRIWRNGKLTTLEAPPGAIENEPGQQR